MENQISFSENTFYLESEGSLTVTSLIHFMRSHISRKDSSCALAEMSNSVQNLNETTHDLVVNLMIERGKKLNFGQK